MRKFVFGYLGLPSDVFDLVRNKRNILGQNVVFEGFPLKHYEYSLEERHARQMLRKFVEKIKEAKREDCQETAYAVICVKSPKDDISEFEKVFFPNVFVCVVEWERPFGSKTKIAQGNNELFRELERATKKTIKALEALRKEVVERANRTPLLLPLKNFRSVELVQAMERLRREIIASENPAEFVRSIADDLLYYHPLQRVGGKDVPCFVNQNKVEFHSPGKALHGIIRGDEGHSLECVMGSRKRLGAPFNPAFHYDCYKGERGNLKGLFFDCHENEEKNLEGDPHINIAPNDFVRI